jgi:lactoylglutathione lyase
MLGSHVIGCTRERLEQVWSSRLAMPLRPARSQRYAQRRATPCPAHQRNHQRGRGTPSRPRRFVKAEVLCSGCGYATIGVVEMTLRFEIFPDDLDATVDFYTRVLRFRLIADRRDEPSAYVSLQRGSVRVGAARRAVPDARAARLPPAGVELVLEVDDVVAEHDRITATGWPMAEDLRDRPWGLRDFRVLDPAGHYLRITDRAR